MARHHHMHSQYSTDDAYAVPAPAFAPYAYGYRGNGVRCVSAPRIGQFASRVWDNDVPYEPGTVSY
jgi:hypothetical protein